MAWIDPHLQTSTTEDAFVQDQSSSHQGWLRKLHIRIPAVSPRLAILLLPGSGEFDGMLLRTGRGGLGWSSSGREWWEDEPLGVASELVQQDGDPIDGAGTLEMRLNFLGRGAIVDVAHEDAPRVDVLSLLT